MGQKKVRAYVSKKRQNIKGALRNPLINNCRQLGMRFGLTKVSNPSQVSYCWRLLRPEKQELGPQKKSVGEGGSEKNKADIVGIWDGVVQRRR